MSDSPASWWSLLFATVALFALAGISWLASHLPLHGWSIPVALAIAAVKSLIILTAFMRLHRQPVANRVVACLAAALLVSLVGFVLVDALRR